MLYNITGTVYLSCSFDHDIEAANEDEARALVRQQLKNVDQDHGVLVHGLNVHEISVETVTANTQTRETQS